MKLHSNPLLRPASLAAIALTLGTAGALFLDSAHATSQTWDGGGGDTNLLNAANWNGNNTSELPTSSGDIATWNNIPTGNLTLTYGTAFGASPNGTSIVMTNTQAGSLAIQSTISGSDAFSLGNITIAANAGAFTFGNGSGNDRLTFRGTNTLTNDSANTATIASDVVFFSGNGNFNRVLAFGGSGNWQVDAGLSIGSGGSGSFNITKTGNGTLTLAAINNGLGTTTTVNGGKLTVSSGGTINSTGSVSIGAGDFNYNSATALTKGVSFSSTGGTLSGTGTITPAVTISNGNRQTAGSSVTAANTTAALGKQIFTTGITYSSGSIFEWNLNSTTVGTRGTDYDAINTASLGGSGATFRVILNGAEDFSASFWDIDRTWAGIFKNLAESNASDMSAIFSSFQYQNSAGTVTGVTGTQGAFTFVNGGQDLKWTAVPEPTSALAGLLITAGLLRRRRA